MAAFWLRVRIRVEPILRSSLIVWSYGLGLRGACLPRATRALPTRHEKTWRTIVYPDFRTRIRRIGIFGL